MDVPSFLPFLRSSQTLILLHLLLLLPALLVVLPLLISLSLSLLPFPFLSLHPLPCHSISLCPRAPIVLSGHPHRCRLGSPVESNSFGLASCHPSQPPPRAERRSRKPTLPRSRRWWRTKPLGSKTKTRARMCRSMCKVCTSLFSRPNVPKMLKLQPRFALDADILFPLSSYPLSNLFFSSVLLYFAIWPVLCQFYEACPFICHAHSSQASVLRPIGWPYETLNHSFQACAHLISGTYLGNYIVDQPSTVWSFWEQFRPVICEANCCGGWVYFRIGFWHFHSQ